MTVDRQWWGFSKQHGWVVLDRDIPRNASRSSNELLFLRCSDSKTYLVKRELWNPPEYRYAPNHIRDQNAADVAKAQAEYDELTSRWPQMRIELHRQSEIMDRETTQRAPAKKRKKALASTVEHTAATPDSDDEE